MNGVAVDVIIQVMKFRRRQVYIHPYFDDFVKDASKRYGVSESDLFRFYSGIGVITVAEMIGFKSEILGGLREDLVTKNLKEIIGVVDSEATSIIYRMKKKR